MPMKFGTHTRAWTQQKEHAARLLAEDRYTKEKIAQMCGIARRHLYRWMVDSVFADRVKELSEEYAERALRCGLARKERRLNVLEDLHNRMLTVIDERSEDAELQAVPGGKTGLVTKNLKGVGKGEDFQLIETYEVDTGLVKEIRAVQEQVAKELGQRVEKLDVNTTGTLDGGSRLAELLATAARKANITPLAPGAGGSETDH